MAYIFNKEVSEDNLINAYNNNIVEFQMDDVSPAVFCNLTISGKLYRISPNPSGVFTFNFKDSFKSLVNQANFKDEVALFINPADADSLVSVDANGYVRVPVFFDVNFENGATLKNSRTYKVLLSVENFIGYSSRIMDTSVNDLFLLSPFDNVTDRLINLTYWEGYPYDIGYFIKSTVDRRVWLLDSLGGSQVINIQIPFVKDVGRFTICDINKEISEHLPLHFGMNYLEITDTSNLNGYNISLKKERFKCGTYVKYMNKYGKWNYHLFEQNNRTERKTKSLKSIDNDLTDVNLNNSPVLQAGKNSNDIVRAHSKGISENEMFVLKGLFESPKVYLFVGTAGLDETVYSLDTDFIEVKLVDGTYITDDYKKNTFNVNCTFELPKRNTLKIW